MIIEIKKKRRLRNENIKYYTLRPNKTTPINDIIIIIILSFITSRRLFNGNFFLAAIYLTDSRTAVTDFYVFTS